MRPKYRLHMLLKLPSTYLMPCHPTINIVFLKTHKTGSSTVQNMLFRFAENHSLSVALPAGKGIHLGYPNQFQAQFTQGFNTVNQNYNILCNHMRFSYPEVQKVMPNNTFYFSILRSPVSLLESSFTYYKYNVEAFHKAKDLNEFLASPWNYYKPNDSRSFFARNPMWYDFGYDNNAEDREDYVHSVLEEINRRFQLILITEYFDESMLLLKNTLCWELEDVVYFQLNSRSSDTIQNLTQESKERVKQWCSLDWKLYEHFNRTFWRKIQQTIGLNKMQKDLKLLQKRQKELLNRCVQNAKPMHKSQIKDLKFRPYQSRKASIMGYNLKPGLDNKTMRVCQRMILPEVQYTALLYARQFPKKPKTLR
ncbi:galactose-3-O-sulfotransferase 2-like isoform X2 [Rhinatrema bivittatum]|uniref:galactose-3-O-sulfotransferase 2-like isoform X2 n=1 Tax=Rhinatrema bivittatum TaxID=194408 RepID=UPI00112839C8|nr:galactose-3-O-sulfotransferase 2-like isoform X2 [Rhinatrema bivittatum]XP_029472976.1 galactose-3-O-sulfotransferase 2-like isoform X2 [Rhinatrema bivittatum]